MAITKKEALQKIKSVSERDDLFEMRKDVVINHNGKDYHFAIAWLRKWIKNKKSSKALEFGITEESYKKNKKDIELAIKQGLQEAYIKKLKRGWKVRVLTGTILHKIGMDFCSGLSYYYLRVQVPRDVWNKIKQYFIYVRSIDEMDFDDGYTHTGWMTSEPKKVEKILKELAEKFANEEEKEIAREILKKNERKKIEK